MLTRAATRLCQANKLSIVPKRGFNGVLYQFSPPKNKLSTGVNILQSILDNHWVIHFKVFLFKI